MPFSYVTGWFGKVEFGGWVEDDEEEDGRDGDGKDDDMMVIGEE